MPTDSGTTLTPILLNDPEFEISSLDGSIGNNINTENSKNAGNGKLFVALYSIIGILVGVCVLVGICMCFCERPE